MTRTRDERGFGTIEAIIAALLLIVIVSSASMMLVGSGRALREGDATRMRAEVARAAIQFLSSDQSWGTRIPACRGSAVQGAPSCDVSALLVGQPWLHQGPTGGGAQFTVTATAQGVDSSIDGVGAADADRRVPDWFELRIQVAGGGSRTLTVDASTDSATRGTGGLVMVRTCAATEQADDRIEPGTCDRLRRIPMPPPGTSGPTVDRDMTAFAVAPSWARQVDIAPISTSCSLTGPAGTTTLRTSVNGSWITPTGLAPGSYRLACAAPPGYEPWTRHTAPAQGVLTVRNGRTATAFVAFRRRPVEVRINQATIHYFRFAICSLKQCTDPQVRSTFTQRFETYEQAPLEVPIQPIGSPYGRVEQQPGARSATGATVSVRPGLYGNTVLSGTSQYYLYVGSRSNTKLGVEFGAPISWFYVHADGSVTTGPADSARSGIWMVRWYCHSGDTSRMLPCPEGRVPAGRGPLQLGGSGGNGAA